MKPKLDYASHGAFVSEAQTKLNALLPGVLPALKADWEDGEKTVARVKQFQKSRGIVRRRCRWREDLGGARLARLRGEAPGSPATPSPQHPVHAKGKKVYFGSSMGCTFGTTRMPIMLTSTTEPATVSDCKAYINIPSLGKCLSTQNPGYIAPVDYDDPFMDVSLHVNNDKLVHRPPCTPEIMTPWLGAFTKEQQQIIDKTATCKCRHGGIIGLK